MEGQRLLSLTHRGFAQFLMLPRPMGPPWQFLILRRMPRATPWQLLKRETQSSFPVGLEFSICVLLALLCKSRSWPISLQLSF